MNSIEKICKVDDDYGRCIVCGWRRDITRIVPIYRDNIDICESCKQELTKLLNEETDCNK